MVKLLNYKTKLFTIIGYFIHVSTKDATNICIDIKTEDLSLKFELNDIEKGGISFKMELKIKSKVEPNTKCTTIEKNNSESIALDSFKPLITAKKFIEEFKCNKKYDNDICLTKQVLMRFINDPLKQEEIRLIGKKIVVKILLF